MLLLLCKREEIVAEHYAQAGTAEHSQAPAPTPVVEETPQPAVKAKKKGKQFSKQPKNIAKKTRRFR